MTDEELKGLESQLRDGFIDVIDFLNAVPDEYVPNKEALISLIKERRNETNSN